MRSQIASDSADGFRSPYEIRRSHSAFGISAASANLCVLSLARLLAACRAILLSALQRTCEAQLTCTQVNMLPLVCNDAVAILFMFDLSRKSTLNSIKEWYRQARGFNKVRLHSMA